MNIDNYLVLIVDLDDDIGRKAGLSTPILGREDNIKAAIKLGLADPGDSDVNSILGGVKLYDELKSKYENVQIALISGDKNVESEECALKIKKQIDFLIYLYNPDFIYLVSDGKEDEMVIKYIEGKDIVVWKKRIVVKQSETLESTYYLIQEFLKKTMEEYIPLILTFIGFSLLLYAIFADIGWRIVVGLLGLYILAEGAGVRKLIKEKIKDEQLMLGKIYPISLSVSVFIFIVGVIYAYSQVQTSLKLNEYVAMFLLNFVNPLTLGLITLVIGKFIDKILHSNESLISIFKEHLFYFICIFITRELIIVGCNYLLGKEAFVWFVIYVVLYVSITIILSIILLFKR
ncbi:DUF373 family protein [Methanocaldococcus indicus]|uniref:DUF373 family protein n=1 Tax=Methanocaldococcus indicus TaxID=213231 RepID=UPI003C6CC95E